MKENNVMSPRKDAEAFIKDQIKIMSKYGAAPKLSAKRYKEVVAEAEKSFQSMRSEPEPQVEGKAKAASKS